MAVYIDGLYYSSPRIDITNITSHSFKINLSVQQGDVFAVPHHYEISVYCQTEGASFEGIIDEIVPIATPYYTVSGLWGGESFFVSAYAVYYDSNNEEIERLIEIKDGVKTPIIPITAIQLPVGTSDTITLSTTQRTDDYTVENLIIRPSIAAGDADNASVLDGTRKKINYSFTGSGTINIAYNGYIWAIDGGRGVCNVKASPADNQGGTPLDITVTVTQAVKDIEIIPDYMQIQLSGGTVALDTIKVLPDDANNKTVYYTSDDTSVLTVDNNGVITPVSAGVTTITVTADDPDYRDSKKITVEVISAANIWHDNYDVCPMIMNTVDFNAIIDNIAYIGSIADLTGLTPPTLQKATPNDAFVLSKGKFEAAFNYVKYVLENSTTYSGFTGDTSQIKTSFTYAPTYSEWNVLLTCINDAKAYVESN